VLTRIDGVAIGVADLAGGIAAYRRIGFEVDERGVARTEGDRLELTRGKEGLQSIALASDDLAADSARRSTDYVKLVSAGNMRGNAPAGRHPNGVLRIERTYIVVTDLKAAVERYSRALGVAPKMERGTVINADLAIFQLGANGFGLAQPVGPGVCADALKRRGPGPFQVLYRTRSMDAAAKWIADHGLPPPARGIRNTGEQAMLVLPEYACGVYIGFVGMA
jgi:catechol 2,3-dioxygenase-like lactoylglutathione lyase family enzyme